ncbi:MULTISPECIES: hypothetical protein [unclassified Caballeronia]|jgi:hypothetical protein|uniref:hypothetical protein n=1 Tax=unclassified Caballeronia TaxID=2646786 RepID=UPI002028EDFD|nr:MULTISPECIES: hypothetical protein [unclassified Caballeronia]MDR5764568.1 hypothetical protein [Caballeronia sp. LZ028]
MSAVFRLVLATGRRARLRRLFGSDLASRIASALKLLFVISPDWTMFFAAYQAPCHGVRRLSNTTDARRAHALALLRRIAASRSQTERKRKHERRAHSTRAALHFARAVPKSNRNIA